MCRQFFSTDIVNQCVGSNGIDFGKDALSTYGIIVNKKINIRIEDERIIIKNNSKIKWIEERKTIIDDFFQLPMKPIKIFNSKSIEITNQCVGSTGIVRSRVLLATTELS